MGRPAKALKTMSRHNTKSEIEQRQSCENTLRGNSNKILPPNFLSKNQKSVFKNIVDELESSGILGNIDIYILTNCCIAIDRLQMIEDAINKDLSLLSNSAFMASKEKYTKDLYRCCNELSLSPQARAKMSTINVTAKQDSINPLIQAIKGDGDTSD